LAVVNIFNRCLPAEEAGNQSFNHRNQISNLLDKNSKRVAFGHSYE
jgi:hypothetical protein